MSEARHFEQQALRAADQNCTRSPSWICRGS
jgi:hypothetical protein